MTKAFDIPDGDADRSVTPLAHGPGTAQLDLSERRDLRKISAVRAGIERAVAHGIADGRIYLRDGRNLPFDRPIDPIGRARVGRVCRRRGAWRLPFHPRHLRQKNVFIAPMTLCRSSIS